MRTIVAVSVAIAGLFFNFPSTGASPGNDLDLPPDCDSIQCDYPGCDYTFCSGIPHARCVEFCNGCVARFFVGGEHMSDQCDGQIGR